MGDDLTPGELSRRIDHLKEDLKDDTRAIDDRLTKIAGEMLPSTVWQQRNIAVDERFGRIERDLERLDKKIDQRVDGLDERVGTRFEKIRQRGDVTFTKVMTVISVLVALGLGFWAALAKGH